MINRSLSNPVLSDAERQQWYTTMGKDFMHVHHYCWALILVGRGNQSVSVSNRLANYKAAIANFDYVIRDVSSTFALKPEVFLRKGMTLRLMGEDAAASKEFVNAIQIKPDYTPAYAALIDLQLDLGNKGGGREGIGGWACSSS